MSFTDETQMRRRLSCYRLSSMKRLFHHLACVCSYLPSYLSNILFIS